jgi:hypothetical protein
VKVESNQLRKNEWLKLRKIKINVIFEQFYVILEQSNVILEHFNVIWNEENSKQEKLFELIW